MIYIELTVTGEQSHRQYTWTQANPETTRFGVYKPYAKSGRAVASAMTWVERSAVVDAPAEHYRERSAHQLGQTLQPNQCLKSV
jgi:hypothetical protein